MSQVNKKSFGYNLFNMVASGAMVVAFVACGDGTFSNSKTFASKQLSAVEMTEGDEAVLGMDTVDYDSGESVALGGDEYGRDGEAGRDGENGELNSGDDGYPVADGEDGGDDRDNITGEGQSGMPNETVGGNEGMDGHVDLNCRGKGRCHVTDEEKTPVPSENGKNQSQVKRDSDGGGNYICILEGNGKSMRLGLVDTNPEGKVGTPSVICMSKVACLDIVGGSEEFNVKMAHKRGFCPNNNPNVLSMTDGEVELMLTTTP